MKVNGAQRTGQPRKNGTLLNGALFVTTVAAPATLTATALSHDSFPTADYWAWFFFISLGILLLWKYADKDLRPVAIALPILLVSLLGVMLSDDIAALFQRLLATDKTETIKILGLGISGVIAVYGFAILNRRARAQDDANELTRFNSAVEHLANKRGAARIASFYEFLYLARDVPDYAENILGILSAYLHDISDDAESKVLPAEKQTLVDVLFSAEARNVFGQFGYDLQEVNLMGIKFQKMHKPGREVDFTGADFTDADFGSTDLKGFNLQEAILKRAKLEGADLSQVRLLEADLSNADLYKAKLPGAMLSSANFSGADLREADFSGAGLSRANFSNAGLLNADFSGAILSRTDFSGAGLSRANFSNAGLIGANFSGTDLRGADFRKAEHLEDATLSGAKYNSATIFPDGFNVPENMIKED